MKANAKRLAALLLVALMLLTSGCQKKAEEEETTDNNGGFRIGYAEEGVTVIDSMDTLQREYDELVRASQEEGMSIAFLNTAVSVDGVHVDCYMGNSASNHYDMFIAIYGDENFTDELYLSQLLRPGTAFETIELERKLPPGDHVVYVAYTTIEEVDGQQAIHDQNIVAMTIQVMGE